MIERVSRIDDPTGRPGPPAFSIVIPTYGRPVKLAKCLAALAELDYPKDQFEIVVVDDGSPNSPEQRVREFGDRLNINFVRQTNRGPAAARNTGAKRAMGRILVFTDDDCQPDPGWLRGVANAAAAHGGAMVGGRIVNGLPNNPFSAASQALVTYLYGYYGVNHTSGFFCSNNFAVPAGRFWEIGGFDETFPHPAGEDRDLCDRWRLAGYPRVYEPDVIVHHFHAMNLFGFMRQHFRYGEGAHSLNVRRRSREEVKLRPEAPAFYWKLLQCPFAEKKENRPGFMAVLLLVSQIAGGVGFGWGMLEDRGSKPRSA